MLKLNEDGYVYVSPKTNRKYHLLEGTSLGGTTTSDIVIVNLDGLNTSDGTKQELHDTNYHKKIPVIAFGERRLYEDLHPWVKDDITRVEENAQDVVNYIRDFYMI